MAKAPAFFLLHQTFGYAIIINRKGKATETALPPNNNFLPHKRQAVTIASSGGYFFFPL